MPAFGGTAVDHLPSLVRSRRAATDSNVGSAKQGGQSSDSASTLLSTLAPVAVFAAVWLVVFLVLRRKYRRVYQARSVVDQIRAPERSPLLPQGLVDWVGSFFALSDTHVLQHHSLDGYLFLRFLKLSVVICLVGCLITWPVLFPVNATGGGGRKQLDLLSFSNVTNNYYRFFAHAGCAYLFFGFIMFMITRESIFYINLRQAFLMSPLYASRLSSRTVLFTSVPAEYHDEAKLRDLLGPHVQNVWISTDTKELDDMVKERDKVAMKLEGAETKLTKLANAARLKSVEGRGEASHEEEMAGIVDNDSESGSVAARYVLPKQRPMHRLKLLVGKKVDTINWSRAELGRLVPKVEAEQQKHRSKQAKTVGSVFVEFDNMSEAQAAFQSLTHHQPLHMAPRYAGVNPAEVIWSNLRIKWWERVIRNIGTIAFVVALVVFWSVPVAAVGAISNIQNLMQTKGFGWLSFLNKLPTVIFGVVTGLLPVILLSVLMSLLPIILRLMARIGGDPTRSAVELTVQNSYFAFQVIQVFLVSTLSSAASAAISSVIADPASVTSLLSSNLPLAGNYFISYIILQGLAVVAGLLVGLSGLVIGMVLGKLLDSTPRKMYKRWTSLAGLGWGTVFPVYTNMLVIAVCYACITPLVAGFAAIGLYLFYLAYRYKLLFVYDADIDTKGLVYPRALQQVFVGVYLAEICLIGLFAINLGSSGALGPFILMIILLVFTVLYQISLNAALSPLLKYLPKSIAAEERALLASETEDSVTTHDKSGELTEKVDRAPHKKPNMLTKWLRPDVYTDYATMRRLVPHNFVNIEYEPEVQRDAFFAPSITSQTPVLWIPRDAGGVSRQEVAHTSKVIPISDEGARLDEKNKIVFDHDSTDLPVYEEKIYY